MKSIHLVRALALAGMAACLASGASAQTLLSGANVDVKVTLTSQCKWATSAPTGLTVNFTTYTAFQATAQTAATTAMVVQCTRGFGTAPTISWDTTGGTAAGVGTVAGLQYALSVTAGAPTAGSAATTASIGTADSITFTLGGSMPAGQAGTAAAGVQTAARQLTMIF